MQGMSGYIPLTFTEINNYMIATKVDLSPSEVQIIKKMSNAYVNETYNKSPTANPPYIDSAMMIPQNNSASILAAFQSLAK